MIRQVCYLSTARASVRDADIQCILGTARHHNRLAQVTGLLAVGGGMFFQVLEGPRDNIECLLRRVGRDARHGDLRLLSDEMVSTRDFGGWPLAFRTMDATAARRVADGQVSGDPVVALLAAMGQPSGSALAAGLNLAA